MPLSTAAIKKARLYTGGQNNTVTHLDERSNILIYRDKSQFRAKARRLGEIPVKIGALFNFDSVNEFFPAFVLAPRLRVSA
jgi:hypothetical protein